MGTRISRDHATYQAANVENAEYPAKTNPFDIDDDDALTDKEDISATLDYQQEKLVLRKSADVVLQGRGYYGQNLLGQYEPTLPGESPALIRGKKGRWVRTADWEAAVAKNRDKYVKRFQNKAVGTADDNQNDDPFDIIKKQDEILANQRDIMQRQKQIVNTQRQLFALKKRLEAVPCPPTQQRKPLECQPEQRNNTQCLPTSKTSWIVVRKKCHR